MTKKEATDLLCISDSTMTRRMKSGRYTFTRTGDGQYAPVSFTYSDLGLPEPVTLPQVVGASETVPESGTHPEPASNLEALPEPESNFDSPSTNSVERPLDPIEQQRQSDLAFAEAFKRGEATDSAGNRIDGSNAERPTLGQTSLLGPSVDATQRPAADLSPHEPGADRRHCQRERHATS